MFFFLLSIIYVVLFVFFKTFVSIFVPLWSQCCSFWYVRIPLGQLYLILFFSLLDFFVVVIYLGLFVSKIFSSSFTSVHGTSYSRSLLDSFERI